MIPHGIGGSQTTVPGTSLSVAGYRCMVPAMLAVGRSARAALAGLLVLGLLLGVHGLIGAIHSVHHLPQPAVGHTHGTRALGHDDGGPRAPAGAPDGSCPVAAAALQLSATTAEAAPALGGSVPVSGLVSLATLSGPRLSRREPADERAPPLLRPLPS